jgi:hypothetical protein
VITVCFITNIPVPYREKIHEKVFQEENISYYVIYCQQKELNRKWNISLGDYKKIFLRERVFEYRGRFVHFNPDVLTALNKLSPSVVITTGFTPTFIMAHI